MVMVRILWGPTAFGCLLSPASWFSHPRVPRSLPAGHPRGVTEGELRTAETWGIQVFHGRYWFGGGRWERLTTWSPCWAWGCRASSEFSLFWAISVLVQTFHFIQICWDRMVCCESFSWYWYLMYLFFWQEVIENPSYLIWREWGSGLGQRGQKEWYLDNSEDKFFWLLSVIIAVTSELA